MNYSALPLVGTATNDGNCLFHVKFYGKTVFLSRLLVTYLLAC